MAAGPAVLACSVADPFMVLLMEDGSVQLLTVEVGGAEEEVGGAEVEGRARLVQSTPQIGEVRGINTSACFSVILSPTYVCTLCHFKALATFFHQMSKVVCVSAFVDTSGLFTTEPSLLPTHNVGGVKAGGVSVKQEVSEGESPGEGLLSPPLASGCGNWVLGCARAIV